MPVSIPENIDIFWDGYYDNGMDIQPGYCHCGCGGKTPLATRDRNGYRKGEPILFLRGHIGKLNSAKVYAAKLSQAEDGTTLKNCTYCGAAKPLSAYNKSRSRGEHLRAHCKDCERKQAKDFYQRNPEPYKRRARIQRITIRDYLLAIANDIKIKNGCKFCGEKEVSCLDFHHVKKGQMPVTRAANKSYVAFEREINKCVVACASCHRKIHAGLITVDMSMIIQMKVPRLMICTKRGVTPNTPWRTI